VPEVTHLEATEFRPLYMIILEWADGGDVALLKLPAKGPVVVEEGDQKFLRMIGDRLLERKYINAYQIVKTTGWPKRAKSDPEKKCKPLKL
jgi:hypothetical protein